ncbi:MAG: patatin-like phospholipase family protein, partial [Saprospiraceae bacterium]
GLSPDEMLDIAKNTSLFSVFKLQFRMGLMDLSQVKKILSQYIPKDNFSALKKKLFVCVTNIEKGKWEIREEGVLFKSIIASCSIPLIFKPIEIDGQLYVDGGVLNNLPIEPLRLYCDKVIGVSVMPIRTRKVDGMMDIAERCIDLVVNDNSHSRLSQCDVSLEIDGIDNYGIFDFNKAEEIYQLGYQYAKSKMETIKQAVND